MPFSTAVFFLHLLKKQIFVQVFNASFLLQSEYSSRSRRSADFDNSVFAEPRLSQYYGGDPQAVRRSFPELSISQPVKADVSPRLSKSQGNIKEDEASDFYACH